MNLKGLLLRIVKDHSIIKNFQKAPSYTDEPKLWQYSCKIADLTKRSDAHWDAGYGGGASFNKHKAIIKAVGEAIERYCLGFYKEKNFLRVPYKKIKDKSLPLEDIISFSKNQLLKKGFKDCNWQENDVFFWIKGFSLFDEKEFYIPSQLVFVPYNFRKEKIIRLPISTGGASGTSFNETLLRGTLEVIERDAFMIHYLSSSYGELIDFQDNPELSKIKRYFKKYHLDLYLINLPTDINVYNFLALIIDKTGVGPAVSAGLKSGLDPLKVAVGAIEECWHSRPWIRDDLNKLPNLEKIIREGKKLTDVKKRGLFWSSLKMLKYIYPWIQNRKRIKFKKMKSLSTKNINNDLSFVLKCLKEQNHKVYYVDVTRPEVARYGFKVLKVIIPSLHPLYLDEPFPYLGGERLYNLPVKLGFKKNKLKEDQLNKIPHFFL
jgi:ribosomal protein S12 methylthiotransferase accessory factor